MRPLLTCVACAAAATLLAQSRSLQLLDVYALEYVSSPEVSPDGTQVAYLRHGYDVMSDVRTADLWHVYPGSNTHRPLVVGEASVSSPRFSPDGSRLAYVSDAEGGSELFVYYLDTRVAHRVTRVEGGISNPRWSPDGTQLAFNAPVGYTPPESVVRLPPKPEGAEWNEAPSYTERLQFRSDGVGELDAERRQLFVVPADGRAARQLTRDSFDVTLGDWHPDGQRLLATANLANADELSPNADDLIVVDVATGAISTLTEGGGPDRHARYSPSGERLAYLNSVDDRRGYENAVLQVDLGGELLAATATLDRSVDDFAWVGEDELVVQYDDDGDTRLARVSLPDLEIEPLVERVGGLSLGRPYSGGQFSASADGEVLAFTLAGSDHPADLAVYRGGEVERLTDLTAELRAYVALGEVEEIRVESEAGGESVEAWIVKPPGFDAAQDYPLLLEIHGGPYTNYGDRFSMEAQLYAAAGYVVVYANPRGSTSYGERFANLIEDNYPGEDYDDLMAVVDEVVGRGYVDEERVYVTGGSGGGVLTAWIVGSTDRFRAAVVAKPVINWASFVLSADGTPFFSEYWFAAKPWEDYEAYWRRSPLSLVGNVTTPTMLLVGDSDYRTPVHESEQYYTALKLRGVPTALVKIPGAGHSIAQRPSNLMAKVSGVLGWFERFGGEPVEPLLER